MLQLGLKPSRPVISVVAPCYNEEETLPEFVRRVVGACAREGVPYEVVLVNDGSRDKTWVLMQSLAAKHPQLVCVNLSRNHGHQLALSAGLSIARGERVLVLDADLQDPPELLREMMALMDRGHDVVYAQRRTRRGESVFKLAACAAFYRIIDKLTETPIPLDTGDFRLISRRALDVLLSMPERHRFIRGMVSWIGFSQAPLLYDRDPRFAGETKYPLFKLVRLAKDGVTSFSNKPLTWASAVGFCFALFAFGLFVYSVVSWLWFDTPQGWASVMAGVALLGGVQLVVLGIIGEYLGRVYDQTKGRPLFIVQDVVRGGDAGIVEPKPSTVGEAGAFVHAGRAE